MLYRTQRPTLEDTLGLELIGAAPVLEELFKLGSISIALGLEVVALVDESTTLLGGRSGDDVRSDVVSLLVCLASDGGSSVQGGGSGSLGLGSEVLGGRGSESLLSGVDNGVGGAGGCGGGFVE